MTSGERVVGGFTLVELMLALALGLLIIAGVSRIYIASAVTSRTQAGLTLLQGQARYAEQALRRAVQGAGRVHACPGDVPLRNHLVMGASGADRALRDPGMGFVVWDYRGTEPGERLAIPAPMPGSASAGEWQGSAGVPLPVELARRAVPGSDILLLWQGFPDARLTICAGATLLSERLRTCDRTGALRGHAVDDGELLSLADCRHGVDLFRQQPIAIAAMLARGTPANQAGRWEAAHGPASQVTRVAVRAFYVGRNPGGEPALYVIDFGSTGEPRAAELVPGVESLQVLGGVEVAGGVSYRAGGGIDVGDTLLSLRVALLVRAGAPEALSDRRPQDLLGTTLVPGEGGFLRRSVTFSVALRNAAIRP